MSATIPAILAAALASALIAGSALAQTATAVQPAAAATATAAPYVVKGFRSALFGMDETAVRAAAAKDFAVAPGDLSRNTSIGDGTTALTVQVAKLEPGPGAATIQYVMGATSGRLIHVNVIWTVPETASAADREKLVAASLQLTRFFRGHSWAPKRAVADLPTGPNSVIAFAGQDASGAAVEMQLEGVAFSRTVNGQTVKSPPPTGPGRLRVAYDKNPAQPDVTRIAQGSF